MEAASKNDNLQSISGIEMNKKWVTINGSSNQAKWQLTIYKKIKMSNIKWKHQVEMTTYFL